LIFKIISEVSHSQDFYLSDLDNSDIFFDPDYLFANQSHEAGITYIAVLFKDKNPLILFPFVLRKFTFEGEIYHDVITPYEYGGILRLSNDPEHEAYFKQQWNQYVEEKNILTEFLRLDPFFDFGFLKKWGYDVIKTRDNIVIDLKKDEDQLFDSYHKNNRRDIRYARRNGVQIKRFAESKEAMEIFTRIYLATMDKKSAKDFYYFDEEYFEQLAKLNADKLSVFIAYNPEDKPVSAALVLHKLPYAHYHLSGTDREYTRLCATNLLLHEAALYLKNEGYTYFHLGGAAKDQQGLYRFKQKFSSETIPYFIARKISNPYFYRTISKKIIEQKEQKGEPVNSSFFPLYRL
jgi:lipid II:glycine glycyltransferase (peptidoglycan interpeptide bridge formation enzyme)